MSWTYSGNPASSDKDAVRFGIGDTDILHQLVQDEEITFSLATNNNSISATVLDLAIALRNKFAAFVDEKTDRVSIKNSNLYEHYKSLVEDIKRDAVLGAVPFAGGISESDKLNNELDLDNVKPKFDKNFSEHENNETTNLE